MRQERELADRLAETGKLEREEWARLIRGRDEELAEEYTRFLYRRLLQVSVLALEDMQPARMGYGCGKAPGIAYVRRFRMKDGSYEDIIPHYHTL